MSVVFTRNLSLGKSKDIVSLFRKFIFGRIKPTYRLIKLIRKISRQRQTLISKAVTARDWSRNNVSNWNETYIQG